MLNIKLIEITLTNEVKWTYIIQVTGTVKLNRYQNNPFKCQIEMMLNIKLIEITVTNEVKWTNVIPTGSWDGEVKQISKHADSLSQLDNGVKVMVILIHICHPLFQLSWMAVIMKLSKSVTVLKFTFNDWLINFCMRLYCHQK